MYETKFIVLQMGCHCSMHWQAWDTWDINKYIDTCTHLQKLWIWYIYFTWPIQIHRGTVAKPHILVSNRLEFLSCSCLLLGGYLPVRYERTGAGKTQLSRDKTRFAIVAIIRPYPLCVASIVNARSSTLQPFQLPPFWKDHLDSQPQRRQPRLFASFGREEKHPAPRPTIHASPHLFAAFHQLDWLNRLQTVRQTSALRILTSFYFCWTWNSNFFLHEKTTWRSSSSPSQETPLENRNRDSL